ncbi:PREDICTED: lysine-specific demethylase 7A [Tarenaya hassleriana]|uniref:lysine-specific demethylase 7A n=1 Tax=Tarenaya hassleriana TaxID=28532 RepID=UPI00053C7DF7|nr:PREDICTED: lysine-specific demethylase 7A [Tarenaya hassleriana]
MDKKRESVRWAPVPQFGAWDQNSAVATDYSVVFSQARANRKQHKANVRHTSLGSERELMNNVHARRHHHHHQQHLHHQHQHHQESQDDEPVMKKKRILTYINCCIRPY